MTRVRVRNLQYWDERGVVSPNQEKNRRRYLPEEVLTISVVADLRDKGLTLREIRKMSSPIKREMSKCLASTRDLSKLYLLTDGRSFCLEYAPDRIIAIVAKSRQPMALVSVGEKLLTA